MPNALLEREKELEKKRRERVKQIEAAIGTLPSRAKPAFPISARDLAAAFEVDYEHQSAPLPNRADVIQELMAIARTSARLSALLVGENTRLETFRALVEVLGRDKQSVQAMKRNIQVMALRLLGLCNVAELARHRLPPGKPGRVHKTATALTKLAAFVYEARTGRAPNLSAKRGGFQAFLEDIFKAYGVKASPRACIAALQKTRARKL